MTEQTQVEYSNGPPQKKKSLFKNPLLWIIVIAVIGIVSFCSPDHDSDKVVAESTPALEMPNMITKNLDHARLELNELNIYSVRAEDVTELKRSVIDYTNWEVCTQDPTPGSLIEKKWKTITFGVAKVGENCGASMPLPPQPAIAAEQVEIYLKESYGLSSDEPWESLCGQLDGFMPYPCEISSITFTSPAVLRITVQEELSKDEATQYSRFALNFLCFHDDLDFIDWVEIADTSGGTRGQFSAAKNQSCQLERQR